MISRLPLLTYLSAEVSSRQEAMVTLSFANYKRCECLSAYTYLEFKMHDETVLPAQKVNQQLHKDVKHVSLIAISKSNTKKGQISLVKEKKRKAQNRTT
jgi:hypothetical protein